MPDSKLKLERLNRVLLAMRDVAQILHHETDLSTLLTRACESLARTRGYLTVWIGQPEADTKKVRVLAYAGHHIAELPQLEIRWDDSPLGNGPCGKALRERAPVIFENVATDPRFAPWRDSVLSERVMAVASFPLLFQNRLLGAITLKTDRQNVFDAQEMELLAGLASDIAHAWQRIEAETAHRETEQQLQTVIQKIPDVVFFKDGDGRWLVTNPAAQNLFQVGDYPWQGRTDAEMAVDRPQFQAAHAGCIRTDAEAWAAAQPMVIRENVTEPGPQGRVREFEVHKIPLFHPDGRRKGLVIVGRDLAERRLAESAPRWQQEATDRHRMARELASARDFYLELLQNSPALIWRAGPDTKCNWFNTTWLEFTGRTLVQEMGNGWAEGVHPGDLESCVKSYLESFARRDVFVLEYRLRRHDGQYRWIRNHGRPFNTRTGDFAGYIGECMDIHDLKLAQEQAVQRQLEKTLDLEETRRELIEAISDNVIFKDGEGRWLVTNAPARRFFEVEHRDWQGKTNAELARENPRLQPFYDACIRSDETAWAAGQLSTVLESGPGLSGKLEDHEVVKVPLFHPDGRRKALLVIGRDVTARRQAEKQLKLLGLMASQSRDIILRIRKSDGRILYGNEAAVAAYGYSLEGLLAQTIYDLRRKPVQELEPDMEDAFHRGMLFETLHYRQDGSCFPAEVSTQGLILEGEESVVSIIRDITVRKQAEEQMRLLQKAVNAAANGLFITDTDGKIVWVNQGFTKLTGYELAEVHGQLASIFKSGLHNAAFYQQMWQSVTSGRVWQGELTNRRKDGSLYYEQKTISPVQDAAGHITHYLCVQEDITAQKRLSLDLRLAKEHALRKAALLKSIMESPQGVIMFALDKNFCYTEFTCTHQQTMQKVWGREIAVGMNMLNLITNPADREQARHNCARVLQGEHLCLEEAYGQGPSRAFYENRYSPIQDDQGSIVGLTVFVIDITERKRAEHALQERQEIFSTIVHRAVDAILLVDIQTNRFVEFNPSAHESLGYTRDEFARLSVADIQVDYDAVQTGEQRDLMREPDGTVFEARHRCRSGEIRDVRISARVLHLRGADHIVAVWQDITEKKRYEQTLKDNEVFVRDILDSLSAHIAVLDQDGVILMVNQAWRQFALDNDGAHLGHLGANYLTVCQSHLQPEHRETAASVCAGIRAVLSGAEPFFTLEYSCNAPHCERWFHLFVWPLGGSRQGVVVAHENITARKQAELALARNNAVIKDLYDSAPCGYHSLDAASCIIRINNTELAWLGYQREEMIGQPLSRFLPAEEQEKFQHDFQQLQTLGAVAHLERVYLRKNGTRLPVIVSATTVRDAQGHLLETRASVFDNTARKAIELQLARSAAEINDLYENAPCGYHSLDAETRIVHINNTELKLLGYQREELIGRKITDLLSPEDQVNFDERFQDLQRTGIFQTERIYMGKQGQRLPVLISATAIYDEAGRFIGNRTTLIDNSERKRVAQELSLALLKAEQANRAKSDFLAKMSHELRTPMNGVLGYTQLLQRDTTVPPAAQEKLGIIYQSGQNLMAILNTILDLSKIESGQMTLQPVDFNPVKLLDELNQLFHPLAHAKGLTLTQSRSGAVPLRIRSDQEKIRQILANLLANAVKFTRQGGIEVHWHFVDVSAAVSRLVVDITDTGPGIAPEERDQLFEKFYQTKNGLQSPGGTGLGLAISRQYARLLGGEVTCPGQTAPGSTFRLEIPVELVPGFVSRPAPRPPKLVRLAAGQPPCRVLIVDDQPMNGDVLLQLLAAAGFKPATVSSGPAALENCPAWQPHLVLMDTRMPEMDGYETIRRLRADGRCRPVKIISVSATAYPEDQAKALAAGADDFVPKPVEEQDLFGKIQRLLGLRFETDAPAEPAPRSARNRARPLQLAVLPETLRDQLRRAVVTGDYREAERLLGTVDSRHGELVAALQALAREFDADKLLELLENTAPAPK